MANINDRKFFKVDKDVFEGTGPENIRKIELPEFKELNLNVDLLGQGVKSGKTLSELGVKPTQSAFVQPLGTKGVGPFASGATFAAAVTQPKPIQPPSVPEVPPEPGLPIDTDVSGAGAVSDTSKIQTGVDKTKTDIEKDLATLGITPPEEDKTTKVVEDQLALLEKRQADLDKRRTEDIARIEKQFEATEGEQKIAQEEALAKAEGRTRIGGVITHMEVQDIQNLQRKFRLENIALEGQKATALQTATRAYEDQNFELAETSLRSARQAEEDITKKKQQYFDNVIKMQAYYERLNKPINTANEADQKQALDWLESAPSVAKTLDIKPSDVVLGNISYGQIMSAYLDSPEYALKQREEKAEVIRKEKLAKTGEDGGRVKFTDTQTSKGASSSRLSIEKFKQLSPDAKNYFINRSKEMETIFEGIDRRIKNGDTRQEIEDAVYTDLDTAGLSTDVSEAIKLSIVSYLDAKNVSTEKKPSTIGKAVGAVKTWWNRLF